MLRDESPTGERCIQPLDDLPICAPMSCSEAGEVLVLDAPCDSGAFRPPPQAAPMTLFKRSSDIRYPQRYTQPVVPCFVVAL